MVRRQQSLLDRHAWTFKDGAWFYGSNCWYEANRAWRIDAAEAPTVATARSFGIHQAEAHHRAADREQA
jgi:hypothetical protein